MADSTTPTPSPPPFALETVLTAISVPARWQILRALAAGEQLMVSEVAERAGISATLASKHLGVLRRLGIVLNRRGRMCELPASILADKEQRLLDFGWCTLRMNQGK
jgi:DNA-binding transcriptional ArsR family regulator